MTPGEANALTRQNRLNGASTGSPAAPDVRSPQDEGSQGVPGSRDEPMIIVPREKIADALAIVKAARTEAATRRDGKETVVTAESRLGHLCGWIDKVFGT